MGLSERTASRGRWPQRVADLGDLTARSASPARSSPSATTGAAPISLGWALAHRDQLRGVVLTNTAVHQPAGDAAPGR